jgi:hypothetical protein
MQVVGHQAHRIQAMRNLLLGFSKHQIDEEPSSSQSFCNQELTAIAPECDVK